MSSPLLSSSRILLIVGVALLVNSQLPAGLAGLAGGMIKPVADLAVRPVQAVVYEVAVSLAADEDETPSLRPGPGSPEALRLAYDEARVEVDRLQQRVHELERRLELIEGVEELGDTPTRPLTAKVTGYRDTGPAAVLSINRGTRQGVAPNQAVVYESAVVGRVLAPVAPNAAEVELITAHDAGLQVRIQPRGSELKYDNIRVRRDPDRPVFLAEVARDSPIRAGADVLLADAVHYADARGRLLGVVEQVTEYTPDPELLVQLVIRPAVADLPFLTEVVVRVPRTDDGQTNDAP
jgi:cell shape-determining protein MreC